MFKFVKLVSDKSIKKLFIWNILLIILQACCEVGAPIMLIYLNETIYKNFGQNSGWFPNISANAEAVVIGILMIIIAVIGLTAGLLGIKVISKLISKISFNARNLMYKKIQSFSPADLDKFNTSTLITRITNDITYINNAYTFIFRVMIKSLFIYIGSAIAIIVVTSTNDTNSFLNNINNTVINDVKNLVNTNQSTNVIIQYLFANKIIDEQTAAIMSSMQPKEILSMIQYPNIPSWSIIVLVFVSSIGLVASVLFTVSFAIKYFGKTQRNQDKVNILVQENVVGQRVVKALNLQDEQYSRFSIATNNLRFTTNKATSIVFITLPLIYFFMNVTILFVNWFVPENFLASLSTLMTLLASMLTSIILSIVAFVQIGRAIPSWKRCVEILTYEPIIKYAEKDAKLSEKNTIKLSNVNFKYKENDKEYVLKDINLEINSGETIGIIGPTSAGKTTLIQLITRMYDCSEGEIKICETNIKDISKNQIRDLFSICPQVVTLFAGTIETNLKFAKPDATHDEIIDAAKKACAYDFIMDKEEQFNSPVVERGNNFSGGQKQRIAIARTLLKKTNFLIFDDSTSALDMITEQKIQHSLFESKKEETILIVAQRISAIKNADRIIVMDKGKIIAFDNHYNLLKNCNEYYEIALSQLGEREVNNELAKINN